MAEVNKFNLGFSAGMKRNILKACEMDVTLLFLDHVPICGHIHFHHNVWKLSNQLLQQG